MKTTIISFVLTFLMFQGFSQQSLDEKLPLRGFCIAAPKVGGVDRLQPPFQLGRIAHLFINTQAGGQAVAQGDDCAGNPGLGRRDGRRGLGLLRRFPVAAAGQQQRQQQGHGRQMFFPDEAIQ